MSRRLVVTAWAGCLSSLVALPVAAQRGITDYIVIEDALQPAAPVVPPAPVLSRLPPQVWKTLAPFKDRAEFDDFRRKARDIAKSHGWTWGFLRQRRNHGPLFAQELAVPCDPAIQDCGDAAMEAIVTTGMRATAQNSITNNQVAGVDEGDIVKAFDRFLVVLMHGRLFSVDTGAAPGELRLADRVNTYQDAKDESWVDEILLFEDIVLVTGYSYETDSSNIALFRIDERGKFSFLARYFIESGDYYSWENYASRIVDGKLVIYTPFDLSEYDVDKELALPRIRRFTTTQGFSEWQPLFGVDAVYRPIQPAIYPSMHVLSVCPVDPRADLRCEARGVVGPWSHEMYVAPDHAYLWLATDSDDVAPRPEDECVPGQDVSRKPGMPSAVYRMTVSKGVLTAVHTEGRPRDQFGLEEKGATFWALVRRPLLACDALDADGEEYEPLTLLEIDSSEFSTRPRRLPRSNYFEMPTVGESWNLQARFAGRHLMYGEEGGRWHGRDFQPALNELIVVPLADPRRHWKLPLTHGVGRLELFGRNAVVFGTINEADDLAVSSVRLAARPRIADTQIVVGAVESEGRSHAFNAWTRERGDGLFGLPIHYREEYRRHWHLAPTYVHYFAADRGLNLEDAAELRGSPGSPDGQKSHGNSYDCEISCYDWYGNSRPIFFRDRIFALIGHEIIEGVLTGGRVTESSRLDLTRPP